MIEFVFPLFRQISIAGLHPGSLREKKSNGRPPGFEAQSLSDFT